MQLTVRKLDQKIIQDILYEVYQKSQNSSTLETQEVVQEMVKQLKLFMNPAAGHNDTIA